VNTASGSLTESGTDLRLPGPGIPFAWTRTYNSRDTTSGALGPGWSHPYWATVTIVNPPTGDLLDYRAGSGQRTRFKRITGASGAATFVARGFDGTLKRLGDSTYELKTRDQRTFTFNTAGNLTQMKPRFGPATTLAYASGKLSSITDSAGRAITITYSVPSPSLIEKVTLPDGRYVQYGYTSGRLTSVRDPRAKTWTLVYDGNGRLTSIQDPVGHYELQNILYDGNGRVTSEQNGTGDAITYAYSTASGYDVTTVTIPGRGDWVYKHAGYLLFQVKNPLNKTTYFTYDGGARKATVKDPRGYLRRFEYDKYGNVLKEIAPQSLGTIVRTFNATNDLLTVKDGRLNTTTYAYATASDAAADYPGRTAEDDHGPRGRRHDLQVLDDDFDPDPAGNECWPSEERDESALEDDDPRLRLLGKPDEAHEPTWPKDNDVLRRVRTSVELARPARKRARAARWLPDAVELRRR